MLYTTNGNSKHYWQAIGQKTSKRDINCSLKNQISISCKNAYLHIMFFITTKLQEILLRDSVELCWRTVLSSIFYFGQISKFKKGHYSQNKRPMGHIAHLTKQFKSINTYDYIITLIKKINFMRIYWFFVWKKTPINSLHPRLLCAMIVWNWLSGSGEEDFFY